MINEFKLERYFTKHEFSVKYMLCSSDPEPLILDELLSYEEGLEKDFKKMWLGYTETLGHPELREEISKLYKLDSNNVIVTNGSEESIFILMSCLFKPEDHVIVQSPNYQSLEEVARYRGCEITHWTNNEDDNWELDLDFLRKNIKENTKAIIINSPHNPTGYLMSKEKQKELVQIAKGNNLYLISDEVYRFLEYNEKDRLDPACDLYENAISISGMSKAFALPGLRIGWVATQNKEVLKKFASFKDYTTICSAGPSEFLATAALRNRERTVKRNLDIIFKNLEVLEGFFNDHKDTFEFKKPKAGSIVFPRIKLDVNIEDFCDDLIAKESVMLLPSTKYDYGDKNFRLGFGRRNMPEALECLESYLNNNSFSFEN